jgi:hypothetical protein
MDFGRDVKDTETLPLIESDVPQWKYNFTKSDAPDG